MEISLSPDNERFIKNKIASGIYKTINEAINAAVNMAFGQNTIPQARIDELNREVETGWQAMINGDVLDGHTVMEEFKKKYAG